jgi:hypothetical protein
MRKNIIKPAFFITVMIVFVQLLSAEIHKPEIELLLLKLDSMIDDKDIYIEEKEEKIKLIKEQVKNIRSKEEEYRINKKIYDEYYVYNADSALVYTERNIYLATVLGNPEGVSEWKINKSFILSATGMLKEALDVMNEIPSDQLNNRLKSEYFRQMIYLYSHFVQYSGEDSFLRDFYLCHENSYKDSIYNIVTSGDPYYLWHTGWKHIGTPEVEKIIPDLINTVENSKLDSRLDAMNAYILASISNDMGNQENFIKYIAYSAIADVRTANKDIASLEELSIVLYRLGDIERAHTYINYCLHNAQLYRNRIRVIGIASILDDIHKSYREMNDQQEKRLRIYLFLVSILSIVLIVSLFFIFRQMKNLTRSRTELNKTNTLLNEHVKKLSHAQIQLSELNDKLTALNEQLRESNYVKEEYIGYVFAMCSNYISKLDNYRKNINRKIKTNKFEEIKSMTNISTMAQNELKEFYNNFDAIFLSLYPNFIEGFNELLHPDKRFVMKEGELLNTELRIYALVRLGIDSSVKISEFLHCSTQTVYNCRLKTRNKSIITEGKFVNAVKSLGKLHE